MFVEGAHVELGLCDVLGGVFLEYGWMGICVQGVFKDITFSTLHTYQME